MNPFYLTFVDLYWLRLHYDLLLCDAAAVVDVDDDCDVDDDANCDEH